LNEPDSIIYLENARTPNSLSLRDTALFSVAAIPSSLLWLRQSARMARLRALLNPLHPKIVRQKRLD